MQTPSKPFQTLSKPFWKRFKLFPNPLQTLCKPFPNASQTPFQGVWNANWPKLQCSIRHVFLWRVTYRSLIDPGSSHHVQYRSNVSWQSWLETWFELDPRSFRESSFEACVSSFDFRGSRTKFRGSSFKFRDTRIIFRGSRTEISRKRFNSRKQNNSDEQNNWHAALFVQTRCWMYANIFSCCAFSARHMRFAYLHWSWWQQTSLASKCVYYVSCQNEWHFFLRDYNPERVCCFHLRDFNRPLKT